MRDQSLSSAHSQELKLEELSKAAKVAKKTIHYYLNKGLLPPAKRVHARLSLYNENHLHLLRLIQGFKEEANLPLTLIRNIFAKRDFDASEIEENDFKLILGRNSSSQTVLSYIDGTTALSKEKGKPTGDFIAYVKQLGLLEANTAALDKREQALVHTLARVNELGLPLEIFTQMESSIDQIMSIEKEMIIHQIKEDMDYQTLVDELLELNSLVDEYISHKKAVLLRQQFSETFKEVPVSFESLNQKLYIPSKAFLEKNNVNQQIDKLRTSTEADNITNQKILVDAYLMIGDYENAYSIAEKLYKKQPTNPDILIALGTCAVFRDDENALDLIEKAVKLKPNSAKAHCYIAMTYLIQASRFNGVFSPAHWLKKSLDAFNTALSTVPETPREQLEILLMKGRAYSILPSSLEKIRDGIDALESLLNLIENNDDITLELPIRSAREVIKINAYFYLGEAYQSSKQIKESQKAFKEVLLADPGSNFGNQAYQRIS